jgi:hypothetical protein
MLRIADQTAHMPRVELVPERRPDGTIVLRAIELGLAERLRRALRKLAHR